MSESLSTLPLISRVLQEILATGSDYDPSGISFRAIKSVSLNVDPQTLQLLSLGGTPATLILSLA
jgi:hypothetical protein